MAPVQWRQDRGQGTKVVGGAIKDLQPGPNGLYRVHVDPPSYLPVASFVDLPASGEGTITLRFPVDPDKVKPKFSRYSALPAVARQLLDASDAVLKFDGKSRATLYDDLDDLRKAGMFNIAAKASRTSLSTGRSILSYVQRILELRGDRCFVVVSRVRRTRMTSNRSSCYTRG